jgi:hypothetical protein
MLNASHSPIVGYGLNTLVSNAVDVSSGFLSRALDEFIMQAVLAVFMKTI